MENFKVVGAVQIKKDSEGALLENPYYQLNLKNTLGVTLDQPVRVSTKYLANKFSADEVDVSIMTARQLHRLIKGMSIEANIEHKEAGEDFIATENTNLVNVGGKWVPAKAGQKYKIQETGYRVDYDQPFLISFDDALADVLITQAELRNAQVAQATTP